MKVFNLAEIAVKCNVPDKFLRQLADAPDFPKSDIEYRNSTLYSDIVLPEIKDFVSKSLNTSQAPDSEIISVSELCRLLGISSTQYSRLFALGVLPVGIKIAGYKRRHYLLSEVENIKKLIEDYRLQIDLKQTIAPLAPRSETVKRQQRMEAGYYSIDDVARMHGVSHTTVNHHIKRQHIPTPTTQLEGFCGQFFDKNDLNQITEYLNRPTTAKRGVAKIRKVHRNGDDHTI